MEIKIYLKSILSFFVSLLFLLLTINILYFFDIIDNSIIKFLKIFVILISSFIGGFIRGFNSTTKGYINGLKLSAIIISFFLIINISLTKFNFSNIIYYIIILLTITFGSMIGINKKHM